MFAIDSLKFNSQFVQGPLAGYSHAAFRALLWPAPNLAYACSEMLPASCVIQEQHDQNNRFTVRHPQEQYLCYQLSGKNPKELALAARILADIGADLIDLNVGCPKKKIRKKGCGSAMLADMPNLLNCIQAMTAAVTCPITVKIRIPEPNNCQTTANTVEQIAAAGASAIILHARHWDADNQPIMPEHFHAAVNTNACPIIINGDIQSLDQGKQLLIETKAAACMLARSGYIKPWIYQAENSQIDIFDYIKKHLEGMQSYMSEPNICLQARSIIHYYGKNFDAKTAKTMQEIVLNASNLKTIITNLKAVI